MKVSQHESFVLVFCFIDCYFLREITDIFIKYVLQVLINKLASNNLIINQKYWLTYVKKDQEWHSG